MGTFRIQESNEAVVLRFPGFFIDQFHSLRSKIIERFPNVFYPQADMVNPFLLLRVSSHWWICRLEQLIVELR
jgi:hypothetical protein